MKRGIILFILLYVLIRSLPATGAEVDLEKRLRLLEEALQKQEETIREQRKMIDDLKRQIKPEAVADRAERREAPRAPQQAAKATGLFGGSAAMNPNISLILNTYAYASSLNTDEVRARQVPGYTKDGLDRRNGFNLEAGELYFFAPVDPYFNLYAAVPVKESGAELEELYVVTTSLPRGHQVKGGKFKSGFGRHNAQHPHMWDFTDAPLPYRAFTGPEGVAEKGVQYTYLAPLPFYTVLGMEILQGENKTLFGADAASGAHAYGAFAKASFDLGSHSTVLFGPSVMTGKSKTDTVRDGTGFSGDTTLYGLEWTYKWQPSREHQFKLQSEYLYRTQYGRLTDTSAGTTERLDRDQDGLYLQGIYRRSHWGFGVRYDLLGVVKNDYRLDGHRQEAERNPWRASGKLDYHFSEFSLLRLQYTHDEADITGRVNHEWFLQFIFGIGAHGAHPF